MRHQAKWVLGALGTIGLATAAPAQSGPDKDESSSSPSAADPAYHAFEEITVTASVRQGGAQDANFFRGEVDQGRIPHPDDLTAEGLMGTHDIQLPGASKCAQLFCLTAESVRADLLALPSAEYLVGIGFTSNIDPARWRRAPLNLVAVVDKSGSMDGRPLELVRQSLAEVLAQLGPADQLSIVLYGDVAEVHLKPVRVTDARRPAIEQAIHGIKSRGSTFMEAGLKLGYQVAADSAAGFKGTTRLMLFTDEQPNVGHTDAGSFMGMAIAGSQHGIGLTTVGVGVQFDAGLATQIGSVRGGNLYFIRDTKDVETLYAGQLDYMVSELAHDLKLKVTPHAGYRIAGVYGVPGQLLGWQGQDSVEVTIPTVFLSDKGGAIFLSLAKAEGASFLPASPIRPAEPIASAAVEYLPLGTSERGTHAVTIDRPAPRPSDGMRLGHVLVDEFLGVHAAVTEHYLHNDREQAFQIIHALARRLAATGEPGLGEERKLVRTLDEQFTFLSGHSAEGAKRSNFALLWGEWSVTRARGDTDINVGDTVEFTPDNELYIDGGEQEYRFNNEQVMLVDSDVVFGYRVEGDELTLRQAGGNARISLTRIRDGADSL